ncbi:chromosome segregation ATPase [Scopulibacillus daqui]|uniref:Chromosome segregation ATPase n=1 Tax=Scopulibacillus daqui TaxID=1469162 RepID=A0ABS2PW13_9BACL|nr:RsfA family transcriptional regulator [Scopulibacillus daqui]MBM7644249.1 chromosome segregation ATPase [Scopulibacillus daqui]
MSTIRQDAWSHDEDLLLAETVLRHIREGSTQLAAFEEVGQKLSRTSAACGFRWNSLVRKNYESAVALAKKQRKAVQGQKKTQTFKEKRGSVINEQHDIQSKSTSSKTKHHEPEVNLETVINYLTVLRDRSLETNGLEKEIKNLKEALQDTEKKYNELTNAHQKLKKDYETIKEDYKALLAIMERARKLAATDENSSRERMSFEFDASKSFEKVNK